MAMQMPSPAASAMTGQPPMGASPISAPSGSPGAMADSMASLQTVLNQLNKLLPGIQPGSDIYKHITDFINKTTKMVPPGSVPGGVQQTQLRGLQQDAGKDAMLQSVMASLGGGSPGGGGAGAAPSGPTPA